MKVDRIDYRRLPGQSPLLLSYLYDFDRVSDFYPALPQSSETVLRRLHRVQENPRFSRKLLLDLLRPFNESIGCSGATFENLRKLEDSATVAILAGQQVGLFGGPSYSAYKAVTAIGLARSLAEIGVTAVPVFWMASDDSDFDEVRSTQFTGENGWVETIDYPDLREFKEQMAGTVRLDNLAPCLERVAAITRPDQRPRLLDDLLGASYREGRTFRQAFAHWLSQLFGEYGLILFDPLLEGYRAELGGLFEEVIRQREGLLETLSKRNEQLEARGFPVQVNPDPAETFLFVVDGERRYKLEYRNGQFIEKGRSSHRYTDKELISRLQSGEIQLGPNVLLRPIVQDHLFPTLMTVGGPSEVAYYSQITALSSYWDLEMVVYPRVGFTVVDPKSQRLMKKYDLNTLEILNLEPDLLAERLLRQVDSAETLSGFDSLRENLGEQLAVLRGRLENADPTVAAMLDNASRKISYQVDKVSRRYVTNQVLKEGDLKRHLDYLLGHLRPSGALQERSLNFNALMSLSGEDMISSLIDSVKLESPGHRIILL
ncbi:MAG: bacillithiol biosynthesis cysteine-adding enzyme BshC [Acidobacteriota bacterium]|nr:MAG: bacillithiol biosynthesis cysteine-adding enzyme BshC [Acidobacteriota bacterium]